MGKHGGKRALYFVGILGTVLYNILQLTIPYFSGKIVDLFLTGENAATNLQVHRDLLYRLLFAMVGFTFLRVIVVYGSCMIYETVSQSVLYRVRNYLYDKLQRQDMTFYSTYRTGDLMTRQTGDLDAVRHMVAWVVRMVVESFSVCCSGRFLPVYELEAGTVRSCDFTVCILDYLSVPEPRCPDACGAA